MSVPPSDMNNFLGGFPKKNVLKTLPANVV
jgi:hypothetical protein